MPARFRVAVPAADGTVTATRYEASPTARALLILAHGAGAGQRHPFMVRFARGIAARGIDVVTFDFLYTERGKKLPDKNATLEACWHAVLAAVRARAGALPIFLGGKSMGGRIASQVAAGGTGGPIVGLVLLGYPLHPPGKPLQLRTEHLARVAAPMLFCQGARDAFGTPGEVRPIAAMLSKGTQVFAVEGGDHSFTVPKRLGVAQDAVYARVLDAIDAFVDRLAPTRGQRARGRVRSPA